MNMRTRLSTGLLSPSSPIPPALQIIPSTQAHKEQITALETTMQGLVLDKKHPLALEIVGADERRSFIIRATTETALDHAEALLRGQYPQIEVRQLQEHEDPFRLEEYEDASAVELVETVVTDSHKPSGGVTVGTSKTDPLLGLLATLSKLPTNTRAILQISLVPFTTNKLMNQMRSFSKGTLGAGRILGKSGVDPKDKNAQSSAGGFGLFLLANMLLITVVYTFRAFIPGWIGSIFGSFLRGDFLTVPSNLEGPFIAIIIVILVVEALLFIGVEISYQQIARIPDLRLVYRTRIRLYVIGPKKRTAQSEGRWEQLREEREQAERRQEILLRMISSYRQFRTSSGTYFITKPLEIAETHLLLRRDTEKLEYGWLRGLVKSQRLISVETLAALWHMPPAGALPELEFMDHRRARTLQMPFEVARQCRELAPIGYSEHGSGGKRFPFGFIPQFFSYHTLITGKSGDGKSAFLTYLAREAMMRGGLVFIDPYGELCEQVLKIVPPSRAEDVVLIDLADEMGSVGLNPLDVMLGRVRDKAIADLLKMLAHIWVSSWGAKMENAFEMSLRTLFEANKVLVTNDPINGPQQQYTLLDVLPILTNAKFCHALLQDIQDDYLHRWWREYYEPLSLIQQRDVITPIIAKVAKFERIVARRIVGQSISTLNIGNMINERKIILLKLSRSIVGSDVAALIGATVLGLIQMTLEEQGMRRDKVPYPLPIILDEFQMLAGADYRTLIELQRFGVNFFLATQSLEYLQKINPVLLPTVMANVKQMVTFTMAAQDAELIRKEIEVAQEDILHLDLQTCYVSLIAANQRQPTFSVKITPLPPGDSINAESIRTRCQVRYTCPVKEVEEMLRAAMLRSLRLAPSGRDEDLPPQRFSPPTKVFPVEEPHTRIVSSSPEQEHSQEEVPGYEHWKEQHVKEGVRSAHNQEQQIDELRLERWKMAKRTGGIKGTPEDVKNRRNIRNTSSFSTHVDDEQGEDPELLEEFELRQLKEYEDEEEENEYNDYYRHLESEGQHEGERHHNRHRRNIDPD